ncbi:hypothetical protein NEOLEDRAFT_1246642 [Neolentinus lepideus HHB14362 ss-1]|uniref:Uncharacterized protein n=1 Tax=Neolentinus lepideus HHB14362 ss-1 TaxID=1314782 RepID=A0A165LTB8_9AGAM|nr:hypothetical protein NEOLEDRAFT_1246647 [Neolentinus lepideus HHB14362 ss-1]KZT17937.1 hypothetical protein NEOLEDRAFT_1246642 [Neolentinus lepideus HHB14362 ss-1]
MFDIQPPIGLWLCLTKAKDCFKVDAEDLPWKQGVVTEEELDEVMKELYHLLTYGRLVATIRKPTSTVADDRTESNLKDLAVPKDPEAGSKTTCPNLPSPTELEQTLALLSSHRSVLGYMLLSRGQPVSIIRQSGVVFEGEQRRKYAQAIGRIVESMQAGLADVSADGRDADNVRFMRIRTGPTRL